LTGRLSNANRTQALDRGSFISTRLGDSNCKVRDMLIRKREDKTLKWFANISLFRYNVFVYVNVCINSSIYLGSVSIKGGVV